MMAWFKAKAGELGALVGRYNNKETAEAIVAVMCGVTYADGEAKPAEKAKFAAAIRINPILKQFDATLLLKKWNDLAEQCEFDGASGLDACLKELADVAGAEKPQKVIILKLGMAAAKADGDAGAQEQRFIDRAAAVLCVDLSELQ